MDDQAVLVAADVEDDTIVADKINRCTKRNLDVGRALSVGLVDSHIPCSQRRFGLIVLGPEIPQCLPGNDLHGSI